MTEIIVNTLRVGRILSLTVGGAFAVGEAMTYGATSNLEGAITYRIYRGTASDPGTVIYTGTALSYVAVSADAVEGVRLRVEADHGGIPMISGPITIAAAAPEPAPPGDDILYQQDYTTDRSGDFSGPMTHYPDAQYTGGGFPGWLGVGQPGAMAFGAGEAFNSSRNLDDIAVTPGQLLEVYWLTDTPGTLDGVSYTGTGLVRRLRFKFYTAAGVGMTEGETYLSAPARAGVWQSPPVPAGAAFLRVTLERRSSAGTAPFVLHYLKCRNITVSGASPIAQTPSRLPFPWALLAPVGGTITYDYAGAFTGDVDRIEIASAPAGLGATVDGTELSLTATENIATGQPIYLRAFRGATQSLGSLMVYAMAATFNPLALRTINSIYLEAGHDQIIDPQYYVTGGAWPLKTTITQKPAWMKTHANGVLTGKCTGSAGAHPSVIATITDAVGATIEVTIPIIQVAYSRAGATVLPAGELKALTGATTGGVAPVVFRLTAGATYDVGTWFKTNRNPDAPIIIMGPTSGMAYINPGQFDQCHGLWLEGNITFLRAEMPTRTYSVPVFTKDGSGALSPASPTQFLQDDLYDAAGALLTRALDVRTACDFGFGTLKEDYWLTDGEPRSFTRFKGVSVEGFETDLSHETGWQVLDDGAGGYVYGSGGTVPTSGPAAITCYRGGLQLGTMGIAQDCTMIACAHPMRASGSQVGFFNNKLSKTRVDLARNEGARGVAFIGNRSGYDSVQSRVNCRASEHQDGVQSTDGGYGCGARVVIEDNFFVDLYWNGTQWVQLNMGSSGSYDANADPRRSALDWVISRNVGAVPLINGINFQGYIGSVEDNLIVSDPSGSLGILNPGAANVRRDSASMVSLKRNILTYLGSDQAFSPWDVEGNVVLTGPAATSGAAALMAAMFPNINENCPYNDPREAVAAGQPANTARFWIDPASPGGAAYAAAAPDWLRDGIAA